VWGWGSARCWVLREQAPRSRLGPVAIRGGLCRVRVVLSLQARAPPGPVTAIPLSSRECRAFACCCRWAGVVVSGSWVGVVGGCL